MPPEVLSRTTNSLGKPIAQTEEGIENFWKWFGDSKIVDIEGRPLVVYHAGSFDVKDNAIFNTKNGVHFGTEQAARERAIGKIADDFIINAKIEFDKELGAWFWSSEGIESFDMNEEGFKTENEARSDMESTASNMAENTESDPEELANFTAVYLKINNPIKFFDQEDNWSNSIKIAKAHKYDGIKYVNQFEDKGSMSYIVFSPNQIKSATDNEQFNPSNPSILQQEQARTKMKFPPLNTKRILTETLNAVNGMNIPATSEIDEGLGSVIAGLLGAGNADPVDQRTIISQINSIKQQDISQLNSLIRNMDKQKSLLKKIPAASESDKKSSIGKTVKDEIVDLEAKQKRLQSDIITIKSEIKVNEEKIKALKTAPSQDQTNNSNTNTELALEHPLPSFKDYLSKS